MDYRKLAKEVRKLYQAFCDEYFDTHQAFELTKFCVKEFPIFREMVKEDMEDTYL